MSYNNNPSSSSYQTGQTSRQPNLDGEEYVPNLSSYETGPAKKTAGPHQSDLLNKLDPRVDSDLNDRAQYAPGTTTTTNVHPGATTHVSNPDASNLGPHSSSLKNKLDPRVNSKTGEMTTKTTNGEGSGPLREPVNTGYNNQSTTGGTTTGATGSRGDVVGGSSTGAPAVPTGTSATDYSREQGSYNPASGTGYTPTHQPHSTGTTAGTTSTTATTQPAGSTTTTSGSKGSSIKGAIAGIHVSFISLLLHNYSC